MADWDEFVPVNEGKLTWVELLSLAMQYPQEIEWQLMGELIKEASRKNDKRPATLTFYTSNEWVKNILGNPKLKDVYIVTRVPGKIVQEAREKRKRDEETRTPPSHEVEIPEASPLGVTEFLESAESPSETADLAPSANE